MKVLLNGIIKNYSNKGNAIRAMIRLMNKYPHGYFDIDGDLIIIVTTVKVRHIVGVLG
jgi:hypothetical protein